jgi:hypothetical protein
MAAERHINALFDVISSAVAGFDGSIPDIQRGILGEVETLLSGLDLKSGRIAPSIANLKAVSRMQGKLESIVMDNDEYKKELSSYLDTFGKISDLNAGYFQSIEGKFKPASIFKEMQKQSIDSTISSLTSAGISSNVTEPVYDLIRQNVTTGTKFSDLTKSLRDYITGQGDTLGSLDRYVKQITTDALNQYSANYMELAAADLNLEWYQYAGVRIETSRKFCIAMIQKKHYHKIEIPDLIKGKFPQFKEVGGTLYKNTGLPNGMVKGTNRENFPIYRGGYNCHHQGIPVSESSVPESTRREVYAKHNIPTDENMMRKTGGKVPSESSPPAPAPAAPKAGAVPVIKLGAGEKFDNYLKGMQPNALRVIDKIRKPAQIDDGIKLGGGSRYEAQHFADKNGSGVLISLDKYKTKSGMYNGGDITFRHEYGHHIDYNISPNSGKGIIYQRSMDRDFLMAAREDLLFLKKKYKKEGFKVDEMWRHLSRKYFKREHSGLSDMIDAVSKGRMQQRFGGFGHGSDYYRTTQKRQAELFANLFEGWGTGGKVWSEITDNFPNLSGLFEEVMKESLK